MYAISASLICTIYHWKNVTEVLVLVIKAHLSRRNRAANIYHTLTPGCFRTPNWVSLSPDLAAIFFFDLMEEFCFGCSIFFAVLLAAV